MGKNGKLLMDILVADTIPTPDNPRTLDTSAAAFLELLESVKGAGVCVPVSARPHPKQKGKWDLRTGARRYAAAKAAEREWIPAVVDMKMSDKEAFDITFIENFGREDLKPLEQAKAVRILLERYDGDVPAVASKLGWTEQAVHMRMRLEKLSPAWRKAVENPASPESQATVAHLELVARLPEATQDAIRQDRDCQLRTYHGKLISVKALAAAIKGHTRSLDGCRWDSADAALVPAAGACSECQKRSDTDKQQGLWEDAGKKAGPARCLDRTCWKKKEVAFVQRMQAELKKEHPNLLPIVDGVVDFYEKERLRKALGLKLKTCSKKEWHDVKPAKKNDKGALPAMVVSGARAGSLTYVLPHGTGGNGSGRSKVKAGPTPLKDRRRALEGRRWAQVLVELRKMVSKSEPSMFVLKTLKAKDSLSLVCAIAAVLGTNNRRNFDRGPSAWQRIKKVLHDGSGVKDLWAQVCGVIDDRLHAYCNVGSIPSSGHVPEARAIGKLLGLPVDDMYKDVCDRKGFLEPKTWANLKADGTPKTIKIPKPKPAKVTK